MVKTRNPLSSEEASGSVGRTTYRRWGQVQTAGRKSLGPSQQGTARQQAVRVVFAALARSWSSLSASQAQQWADYSASHPKVVLGDSVVVPAFDAYCRANRAYQEYYGAPIPVVIGAHHGLNISNLQKSLTVLPGTVVVSFAFPAGAVPAWPIAFWRQGPLANELRALRQPEQRLHELVVGSSTSYRYDGLVSGAWYWLGAGLCPGGVYPSPVIWIKAQAL